MVRVLPTSPLTFIARLTKTRLATTHTCDSAFKGISGHQHLLISTRGIPEVPGHSRLPRSRNSPQAIVDKFTIPLPFGRAGANSEVCSTLKPQLHWAPAAQSSKASLISLLPFPDSLPPLLPVPPSIRPLTPCTQTLVPDCFWGAATKMASVLLVTIAPNIITSKAGRRQMGKGQSCLSVQSVFERTFPGASPEYLQLTFSGPWEYCCIQQLQMLLPKKRPGGNPGYTCYSLCDPLLAELVYWLFLSLGCFMCNKGIAWPWWAFGRITLRNTMRSTE